MISLTCPWCEEDAALEPRAINEAEDFTCLACGTSVAFVDEPEAALDLAA